MRDSFVFYGSYYEAMSKLDDHTYREVMDALCQYALFGEVPECDGVAYLAFTLMKPQVDANNRRYENGKRGGRKAEPKISKEEPSENQTVTKPEPSRNQTVTKPEPNVNVNVNANANVNAKNHKRVYAQDERLNKAICDFIENRKKLRSPMTDRAIELFIKRLDDPKLQADTVEQKIALIETAIERGWKSVYPADDIKKKTSAGSAWKGFSQRDYDDAEMERQLIGG